MPPAKRTWREIRAERVGEDTELDAEIRAGARAIIIQQHLADLRRRRGATQADLAGELAITQSAISQLERGDEVLLSTLDRYVTALGGRLEVRAVFPDETIDLAGDG